ncbi:LIM domain only protein 7 isoform X3 [Colossoma macropomum]|uniref:LIM domain only protein 7 isoform X3 n=1 Tax=Colossoma macropomum TaxID=42526 RepID=UPI001863C8CA|nr:LIM domain only protein 7 isoform X3 [Colossoma macropomum]
MWEMEWREPSANCDAARLEAQRWMEAVTKKKFGSSNFRSSLENGVLLCDLVNKIKPGIIKRVNRLSTPIAGLDNVNIFLKACARLGLKEAQLFHPGDLQDLSTRVTVKHQEASRRLKNVLITIYWLGRKAHIDPLYNGPYLNLKAFEGLLGTRLYKALEDCTSPRDIVRECEFGDSWYSEKKAIFPLQAGHRREDSLDSLDSLGSRTTSTSSDTTLKGSSEGCGSDPEAELGFRMSVDKDSVSYRRSLTVTPKTTTQFNQFLPSKDKQSGYVPAPLRKRRAERHDDNRRSWASPMFTEEDGTFSSVDRSGTGPSTASEANTQSSVPTTRVAWVYEYESSDSDGDRPDPDLVLDDLASRRFHSPSPVTPTNFALPMSSVESPAMSRASWPQVTVTNVPQQTLTYLSSESGSPQKAARRPVSADVYMYEDSEEEDDEIGYADPVQDDLYARKVGLMAQTSATVRYDKFLPKFWTPEEDAHVQKIKLGSQRRPWYRKIQGFSRKKSGSSSEDSDCDVNPWLCVRSPFRSHSEPPPSYPHTPEASAQPHLPTAPRSRSQSHIHPPMQPLTAAQPSAGPPRLELPDFWPRPDPTSGPSLFKCERHPLRGRENPKDPYNVSEDILPDLANDDMFTRRTCAFRSSTELAWLKYGDFLTSHRRSEPYIRVVIQPRSGQPMYPDIERDDVLYRRVLLQSTQRPPSGAPDNYHPVPLPEPWTLPPKLQAKLLCAPCPPPQEQPKPLEIQSEADHLKADDMLVRKLRMVHIQGMQSQSTPSVTSSCSEEDLQKWRAIREASRLRYKKRLMVERLLQKDSNSDGSKSMSDIAVEQAVTKQVQYEQLQKVREQMRESEDKWQDDLTKWKNRRKSVNSDIMKKKEEREQIESLTSNSSTRKSKTFKEMAEERENRGPGSYRSRFSTFSTSDDQDVFEEPAPRSKTLPPRSYTIDNPYALGDKPMVHSLSSLSDDEPLAGSLASDEADSPQSPLNTSPGNKSKMSSSSKENQTSISSRRNLLDDPIPASITSKPSLAEPTSSSRSSSTSSPPLESNSKFSSTTKPVKSSSSIRPVPQPRRPYGRVEEDQSQASLYMPDSVEKKQPEVARVSASLPRSYQRSDSARLTSVVTPRPFGTQSNRVASLPRAYTMDDSHKRFNGEAERSEKPTVPSRYAPFMKEDEAHSQSSSAHSSNEDEEEEEEEEQVAPSTQTISSVTPVSRVSPQPKAVSPLNNAQQESYSDMRISLNQKPGSSRDFGFQSTWDSTGACVKSIQPGSPAQLCHLQVGDEILAVNGHKVADMSYEQWKSSMDQALQQGSLLMDIRRHGKNNWGRDLPSLPFKSHKTINLTSADPLGSPETYPNSKLSFTSHPAVDTAVKTLNVSSQNASNLAPNGINGGIREEPVTLRNKESEPISLKNLKRRSEFFEQGGSETTISDLPVPPLSASSNRWSWDPEEERRRQEKWQKEQERLLQEKYRRDQEKLEEEFRKAQQEALKEGTKQYEEEMRSLELERLSINTYSPLSPLSQASPSLEEQEASRLALQEEERRQREENQRLEEQRRRKEEQERLEEEKRRRAEQERLEEEKRRRVEQERFEEERRRREEQERLEEERRRREERERLEEERRIREQQKRLEEEKKKREEQERQRKEEERRRQEAQERLQEKLKSKSTPELDEMGKADTKGVYKKHRGLADWFLEEELRRKKDPHILRQQAASELELERRSILNAMRYRNPERAISGGLGEKKESLSQAELERQQIIQEMKKKTPLLTDSSWIRQQSPNSNTSKEPISLPMRRGESLDNLDSARPSWRSSWTPGSTSSIPDYSRPYSSSSSHRPASATLPASQSLSSLRQSWATSSTPAQVPNRQPEPQSRNRSVSGKKICTFCEMPLGKGAAMIIESLGLCYHLPCFKCVECKADLGGSEAGAEVRIRNKQLYCNSCYMRVKNGQPTDM